MEEPVHPLIASIFSSSLGVHPTTSSKTSTLPAPLKVIYDENVNADGEACFMIFKDTIGQSGNPKWFLARKYRLTGSRIHKIHRARKQSTLLKYFYESAFKHKNLDYGREMEGHAMARYQALTGAEVMKSGLIISTSHPWISSSPD